MDITLSETPIQPLEEEWYRPFVKKVDMLRLDMLHPEISGNKWYKLQYNIRHAIESGHKTILTFGGAYSNHLAATAAAGKAFNVNTIGIVRGIYERDKWSSTLKRCEVNGMHLVFVSRDEYTLKEDVTWLHALSKAHNMPFIVPEGGANEQGRLGAGEIAKLITESYSHVCVSVGTGTTFAGLRSALPATQVLHGYIPMKGGIYLDNELRAYVHPGKKGTYKLFDEWHFGGFGKHTEEQLLFMNAFYNQHKIPLDMVYTSKMMFGVQQQLRDGFFAQDASILCIHTGGLQGNASVKGQLVY